MAETILTEIQAEDEGERLDRFLCRHLEEWSRSAIQRWIVSGDVRVNQMPSRASYRVRSGDVIQVEPPPAQPMELVPQELPLRIVYEDNWLVVVDKPAGLVVHPGAGQPDGTLANALLFHFQQISRQETIRPGIVHRLDKDTSGLIVVAKDEQTHERIARQFKERRVCKVYVALVYGRVEEDEGVIDVSIGRHPAARTRMAAAVRGGRRALTEFSVVRRYSAFSLLRVKPRTGRTHQIRVHFQSIGHPVVGDRLYGMRYFERIENPQDRREVKNLERHFLHASRLAFEHPATSRRVTFEAPLPDELARLLAHFE